MTDLKGILLTIVIGVVTLVDKVVHLVDTGVHKVLEFLVDLKSKG